MERIYRIQHVEFFERETKLVSLTFCPEVVFDKTFSAAELKRRQAQGTRVYLACQLWRGLWDVRIVFSTREVYRDPLRVAPWWSDTNMRRFHCFNRQKYNNITQEEGPRNSNQPSINPPFTHTHIFRLLLIKFVHLCKYWYFFLSLSLSLARPLHFSR